MKAYRAIYVERRNMKAYRAIYVERNMKAYRAIYVERRNMNAYRAIYVDREERSNTMYLAYQNVRGQRVNPPFKVIFNKAVIMDATIKILSETSNV